VLLALLLAALLAVPATAQASTRYHIVDLGTLGGYSQALGLNDHGQVVGVSSTSTQLHGFVWRDGRMIDLGIGFEDGMNGSAARDINEDGVIAGDSPVGPNQYHAVIWRP
jgi:probable HAF family extracellular repeat protein